MGTREFKMGDLCVWGLIRTIHLRGNCINERERIKNSRAIFFQAGKGKKKKEDLCRTEMLTSARNINVH